MNAEQLHAVLSDEITQMRKGKRHAKDVNAVVNASAKMLSLVRLEMEYAKMLGVVPRIPFIKTPTVRALPKK